MKKKRSFLNGPTMYPNLSVQRGGYKATKDGRANSSAFQQNKETVGVKPGSEADKKGKKSKEKTVEDYLNEGFSQVEAEQMAREGGVTGEIDEDSPNKLLGGLLGKVAPKLAGTKVGGAMQGKGLLGAVLNPLGAIKNKIMG